MSDPIDPPRRNLGPLLAHLTALIAVLQEDVDLTFPVGEAGDLEWLQLELGRVCSIQRALHDAVAHVEADLLDLGAPASDRRPWPVAPTGPVERALHALRLTLQRFGGVSRWLGTAGIGRGAGPGWPDELRRLKAVLRVLSPGDPDGGGPGGKADDPPAALTSSKMPDGLVDDAGGEWEKQDAIAIAYLLIRPHSTKDEISAATGIPRGNLARKGKRLPRFYALYEKMLADRRARIPAGYQLADGGIEAVDG
jgi:hypothetical protein